MTKRGSNHGGRRRGAGKKRGTKWPSTTFREQARAYLSKRVLAEIEALATAQIELAKGDCVMMAKRKNDWVRVTDPDLILKCLKSGDTLYRIVTRDADARALKDIFDREFGRAMESIQHSGADGQPVIAQIILARKD